MGFVIRGRFGRLRSGARTVAELDGWEAEPTGEATLRVRAKDCRPDGFWWEHRNAGRLALDLDFGRDGLRGPAVIESDDPLIVVVTTE